MKCITYSNQCLRRCIAEASDPSLPSLPLDLMGASEFSGTKYDFLLAGWSRTLCVLASRAMRVGQGTNVTMLASSDAVHPDTPTELVHRRSVEHSAYSPSKKRAQLPVARSSAYPRAFCVRF